jgi:hypothetical protein
MEAQTGFRDQRGTIDGLFTTFMSLHKRREHGLETWALFIDLVKAFDTVPREALFAVLRRFGIPDHFVNVIIRLHENALIKVKIGSVEEKVKSSIGVRQGSCEGPVLFLFIMQAAMETMQWPVPKPQFRTRADGVTSGERSARSKELQALTFGRHSVQTIALSFSRLVLTSSPEPVACLITSGSSGCRCMWVPEIRLRKPRRCSFRPHVLALQTRRPLTTLSALTYWRGYWRGSGFSQFHN